MTPKDLFEFFKKNGIEMIDLKFNDMPGLWQHFSVPVREFEENILTEGIGFDGSSIRGFQGIQKSDMVLIPDLDTVFIEPLLEHPTASISCDIYDPRTRKPYSRDPRFISKKAEKYLKETGIADQSFWGPEAEFFIFDDIRFDFGENYGYHYIDSIEGDWSTGKEEKPNLGYKMRYKEAYFPCPPHDKFQDLRSEMVINLQKVGLPIEVHHHEVASGGQAEIDIKYLPLVEQAHNLMMFKYIIKNTAYKHNKTVTFMPKPIFNDNGNGMHVHVSLWKGSNNLFYDKKGYASLSQLGLWFIGGIFKHAKAVMAFGAPTTNSYKRLVPGFEAPVNLVYSAGNRSAAVRIPVYSENPKSKRIEFRSGDPSANPYLYFPALLMAGLDGIRNRIDPGKPLEGDLFSMSEKELKKIKNVPVSLEDALDSLEKDYKFLLEGNVFTMDVIDKWLEYKREEAGKINQRPHPYEFSLYYDI